MIEKRQDRLLAFFDAVVAIAVLATVVTLIFAIWWSYICLGAGLVVIFLIRYYAQKNS